MRAEIDENGTLMIRSETPLEAYALRAWSDRNTTRAGHIRTGNMILEFRADSKVDIEVDERE